jgi:hypothetical protein
MGDLMYLIGNYLGLVGFDRRGNYSLPEFTCIDYVELTVIEFFQSEKLGTQYGNYMFDVHEGRIYHF